MASLTVREGETGNDLLDLANQSGETSQSDNRDELFRKRLGQQYLHIRSVTELIKDELSVRILTEILPDCWLLV